MERSDSDLNLLKKVKQEKELGLNSYLVHVLRNGTLPTDTTPW